MNRPMQLLLVGLMGVPALTVPARSQDKIERRDRKADKITVVSGEIVEETPAGINIKTGGKTELVPATDVLQVLYAKVPTQARIPFNNLFLAEDKDRDPTRMLKLFKDFEPSLTGAGVEPKRYVQFRIAMLTAQSAKSDQELDQARTLLSSFVNDNSTCWEYSLAARQLARMQIEKSDLKEAGKTLEALTKKEGVPEEIKQEAATSYIDVLFQNGEFDKVKERAAAALNASGTTETQKARMKLYEIGCETQGEFKLDEIVKKIEETIAKTTENSVKALAYNILGDCYLKSKEKRKAMWSWLWVDAVYNQDVGEHVKAMNRLLKYFTDESDLEKKQYYEEKIKRLR